MVGLDPTAQASLHFFHPRWFLRHSGQSWRCYLFIASKKKFYTLTVCYENFFAVKLIVPLGYKVTLDESVYKVKLPKGMKKPLIKHPS